MDAFQVGLHKVSDLQLGAIQTFAWGGPHSEWWRRTRLHERRSALPYMTLYFQSTCVELFHTSHATYHRQLALPPHRYRHLSPIDIHAVH